MSDLCSLLQNFLFPTLQFSIIVFHYLSNAGTNVKELEQGIDFTILIKIPFLCSNVYHRSIKILKKLDDLYKKNNFPKIYAFEAKERCSDGQFFNQK